MRNRLLILLILATSCKSNFDTAKQDKQFKEIFIQEFKMRYFKSILKKGFNNNIGYINAVQIDASDYSEPILNPDDLKCIDSLVQIGNNFLITDSIQSIKTRAEGTEGKQIFKYALKQYESKWLDKIAKRQLKKFWKAELKFRKSLK